MRPAHALKDRKKLHLRSSRARQKKLCPLDKDLSWKSAYRKLGIGPLGLSPLPESETKPRVSLQIAVEVSFTPDRNPFRINCRLLLAGLNAAFTGV